ncbi:hypothetical protein [Nonomuraea endophytica]|uniref:hypothetical protein n=1 Tax=Nonomuraea endophytica TaxID=714136 RepID=UPI0037C95F3D
MEQRQWTQAQLADALGVSQTRVSHVSTRPRGRRYSCFLGSARSADVACCLERGTMRGELSSRGMAWGRRGTAGSPG